MKDLKDNELQLRSKGWHPILFHLLFISLIFGFWFIYSLDKLTNWRVAAYLLLYSGVYVAIAYIQVYLFRKYFLRRLVLKYLVYTSTLFLFGCIALQATDQHSFQGFVQMFQRADFYRETVVLFILCTVFSGFAITFTLLRTWLQAEKRNAQLMQANLNAELEALKSSVSPHFLFNTLNNLYVLTKINPAQAGASILELADIIKYQLYVSGDDRVPLKEELHYIKSLLSLEQLRKDDWTISIDFPDDIPLDLYVAPLLLLGLVENAIKHGHQKLRSGYIKVLLRLDTDSFDFIVTNTSANDVTERQLPSLGLANLKRRLEIIYPQRHELNLSDTLNEYQARLSIVYES